MIEVLEKLERDGLQHLQAASDPDSLEAWRIKYLGTKGALKAVMPRLKDVPKDQKPAVGQRLNQVKDALETAFEQRKSALRAPGAGRGPVIDVTEPGLSLGLGRRHILTRTIDEITDVFGRMGFSVAHGPEVEDEWHNFNALNIPAEHPAREPSDNFYLERSAISDQRSADSPKPKAASSPLMLRSQTSTVQIRTMEKTKPPLKVVAVGRVYRPDTHDATHFSMFHQIEGLHVDRNISMVDLKTSLFQFARAYFGPEAEVRMRPSFFPFTEPSAEVDMKMKIKGEW
ncbi:MAG: phenylalanine--tRNA ligase subunit alpha, partial [Phycisphaerales bacterium]|nr:phenylalanine--tRNA ligase subunit alpha [Phycisphaerales bacterium]